MGTGLRSYAQLDCRIYPTYLCNNSAHVLINLSTNYLHSSMSKIQTTEQPGGSVNLTEVQNRCMQKIKTEAGSDCEKKSGWHFRQLRELAKSDHNEAKFLLRSLSFFVLDFS